MGHFISKNYPVWRTVCRTAEWVFWAARYILYNCIYKFRHICACIQVKIINVGFVDNNICIMTDSSLGQIIQIDFVSLLSKSLLSPSLSAEAHKLQEVSYTTTRGILHFTICYVGMESASPSTCLRERRKTSTFSSILHLGYMNFLIIIYYYFIYYCLLIIIYTLFFLFSYMFILYYFIYYYILLIILYYYLLFLSELCNDPVFHGFLWAHFTFINN